MVDFKKLITNFSPRSKNMSQYVGLGAFFCVCFMFFLYMTFPYGVLKESITGELSRNLGYEIQVGKLGPSLPLGFVAEDIRIVSKNGGQSLNISGLSAKISILNLFILRLGIDAEILAKGGGRLEVNTREGLFHMLFSGVGLPSRLTVNAVKFPLNDIVTFFLRDMAQSPDTNPLLSPMLAKLNFSGNLNGAIDLDLDASNPAQSSGDVDVKINDGRFDVNDPSLNIAEQKFSKALIKASLQKGSFNFDNNAGLQTQELDLGLRGRVQLKENFPKSQMDLVISLKLDKGLNEQFGFLIGAAAGGKDGAASWPIKGTLGAPQMGN